MPGSIYELADANLQHGMQGTRSYRNFPVWGRVIKDELVQVVTPYELNLYKSLRSITIPQELNLKGEEGNPVFVFYSLIWLRYVSLGCTSCNNLAIEAIVFMVTIYRKSDLLLIVIWFIIDSNWIGNRRVCIMRRYQPYTNIYVQSGHIVYFNCSVNNRVLLSFLCLWWLLVLINVLLYLYYEYSYICETNVISGYA